MILQVFILIIAMVAVIFGGDFFVDSSIVLAKRTKIPTIIIGATIVSFATTLPEFIVSTIAAIQGNFGLSIGNASGSVICNTALICGLSIAILPSIIKEKTSVSKYYLLIFSAVFVLASGFSDSGNFSLEWFDGTVLIFLFVLFMTFNIIDAVKQMKAVDNKSKTLNQQLEKHIEDFTILESVDTQNTNDSVAVVDVEKFPKLIVTILFFIFGAALIGAGSYAMVESATKIAHGLGISETVIGLTIVEKVLVYQN